MDSALLCSGLGGGHGSRERRDPRVSESCAHVLSLAEEELRCKQSLTGPLWTGLPGSKGTLASEY